MKTFQQFITEVYDKDIQGRSTIKKPQAGGRIEPERKKDRGDVPSPHSKGENPKARVKAIGGGKTAPVEYKKRSDVGKNRPKGRSSERLQQPTQKKGVKLSAREQQRKARAERLAAKSGGKSKAELEKAATKLLTKKTTTAVSSKYKPTKASGYTKPERRKLQRAGDRLLSDIKKKKEKSASHYDPKL